MSNIVYKVKSNWSRRSALPLTLPHSLRIPMCNNPNYLDVLNHNENLDFFTGYNRIYHDTVLDDNPYYGMQISSKFYDIESLASAEFIRNRPIFLSINIQSLQSKFEQLRSELDECASKNISIDVIALQEIWDVSHPELFVIPGYKPLICKKRRGMRGGGVGFFVKDHLSVQILEENSPFENKL